MLNSDDGPRFEARGNLVAWAFVPYAAWCQAIQLALPIPGVRWLTFESLALLLLAAVSFPWWRRRWRELGPVALTIAGAFLALVTYGLVRVCMLGPATITSPSGGPVPQYYLALPLISAAMTVIAGMGLVLCARRDLRLRVLVAAGAASLVVSFVGWPFQSAHRGYIRLATGQGGAAIIHVAFLLIVGLGMAWYFMGKHRWLALAVVAMGVIATMATQSRGALLNLAAFIALVVLGWLLTHPKSMRRLWPVGIAILAGLLAVLFIPGLERMGNLFDPDRASNYRHALSWWGQDPWTMILGVGPGQVWPWSGYESGLYPMPGGVSSGGAEYFGTRPTAYGNLLLTPHSTPISMLVEMGIPGAIVAIVMAGALLVMWWKSRRELPRLIVASAVCACLVAFLVDTYLLRNFGISWWWWACLAAVATWPRTESSQPAPK